MEPMKSADAVLTLEAARPPIAPTPSVLNMAEPTMVPIPRSDLVTKVLMMLMKSSGEEVATAMKVAAATSCGGTRFTHVSLKTQLAIVQASE